MSIVGAFNVGSINIAFDEKVQSNKFRKDLCKRSIREYYGIYKKVGEELGMFKLGSTIVMLMEVDKNYKLNIKEEQSVRYGQILNSKE